MEQLKFGRISIIAVLVLGLFLSGCQGGSSDTSSASGVTITPADPVASTPSAAQVSTQISWTIPTTRVLGDFLPMSEIKGYRVSFGTSPGKYTNSVIVNDAQQTSADLRVASGMTYYFVVRAIDTAGLEGPESNMVVRSV